MYFRAGGLSRKSEGSRKFLRGVRRGRPSDR